MKRFKFSVIAIALLCASIFHSPTTYATDTVLYGPISCMSYYRIWAAGVIDDYSLVIWHGKPTSTSADGWYVNGFDGAAVTTAPTLIVTTKRLNELEGETIGGWMVSRFQLNSDGSYSVHGWENTILHNTWPYGLDARINAKWRMDISAAGVYTGHSISHYLADKYIQWKTVQIGTNNYAIYEDATNQTIKRYSSNHLSNYGTIATSANSPYIVPNTTSGSLTYILYYLQDNVMYGKYMQMVN